MNTLPLILLGGLCLVCCSIWLLIPAFYGLPWVPTQRARIRRALQLANLQPGETLYDLGSGDGRVLVTAAKEFGACAVGIEIGPMQCLFSRLLAWYNRCGDNVQILCRDFYKVVFHDADVVFIYVTSTQIARLRPLLEAQLQPGARVVSIAADFPEWQPIAVDRGGLIFVYVMQGSSIT